MYSGEYSVEAEAIHAINYRDAVTWHSKGAPIYLDSFQMPNRSTHANDMFFALGLHYSDHLTEGEKFMDQYYPQVLRNFVKTGRPDEEWEPLKDDGSGYFSIEAIRNGSDIILPHQKNTYFYQEQIHFWLSHLSSVNERAIERQNRTERSVLSNSFLLPLVTNQLPLETNSEVAALKEANESLLSAFWVVVVIALVLASALLVMAISNHLNRRMQNSYYFAEETEIFGNSGKAGVVLYGSIN
uniref:COesterase domain-containing protein n=1 Tax=Steinernema glaseri TaxID=37863 RepID=A0A1I8AMB0_9BILA